MATGRIPINGTAAIQSTIVDAKGDLIAGTAADAVSRLAIGSNNTVLTADSAEATGMKWAAAAGGGKVLQVVFAEYSTATTVASTSYADSGLSASITPSAASSKVLIFTNLAYAMSRSNTEIGLGQNILRGATSIFAADPGEKGELIGVAGVSLVIQHGHTPLQYLDSPNTTSATTYKLQIAVSATSNGGAVTAQENSRKSSIILMEIGA